MTAQVAPITLALNINFDQFRLVMVTAGISGINSQF